MHNSNINLIYIFNRITDKVIHIISSIMVFLVCLYIFFIIYNRKQKIIKDTGYFKILLITIGYIIYLLSINYNTYMDYNRCANYIFIKHLGISLITIICYIYISYGFLLGSQIEQNDDDDDYPDDKITHNSNTDSKEGSYVDRFNNKRCTVRYSKNESIVINDANDNANTILWIRQKNATSLLMEIIYIYPIFVIALLLIIIYYKNNESDNSIVQGSNDQWFYKCDLENIDFILNSVYLMIHIQLLLKGLKTSKYDYIFRCTRYITYSMYFSIFLGPSINVS